MSFDVNDLDLIWFRESLTDEEVWWIYRHQETCINCHHRGIWHITHEEIACLVDNCECPMFVEEK